MAKQGGLLASLAGIEGLRVVTLSESSRLSIVILFTRHTSSPTNRFSIHRCSNINSLLLVTLAIRTRKYRNEHG